MFTLRGGKCTNVFWHEFLCVTVGSKVKMEEEAQSLHQSQTQGFFEQKFCLCIVQILMSILISCVFDSKRVDRICTMTKEAWGSLNSESISHPAQTLLFTFLHHRDRALLSSSFFLFVSWFYWILYTSVQSIKIKILHKKFFNLTLMSLRESHNL